MKTLFSVFLSAFFFCSANAKAAIYITSPLVAAGQTVTSTSNSVKFSAYAAPTDSHPITAIRLYVNSVNNGTWYTNSFSTTKSLSNGTYGISIVAWNSAGAAQKSSFTLVVKASVTTTPTFVNSSYSCRAYSSAGSLVAYFGTNVYSNGSALSLSDGYSTYYFTRVSLTSTTATFDQTGASAVIIAPIGLLTGASSVEYQWYTIGLAYSAYPTYCTRL